jgi:hypothetical protein
MRWLQPYLLLGALCACGTPAEEGVAAAAGSATALESAAGCRNPLVGQPVGSVALQRFRLLEGGEAETRPWSLLRWWTVDCPHCRASLPDLSRLAGEFPRLQLFAVFHPKGLGAFGDERLRGYLGELGVSAQLARDDDWRVLESLRTRGGLELATSISVLVDPQGVVRWVHPGPRLHRSEAPEFADADADWRELRQVLGMMLAEGAAPR